MRPPFGSRALRRLRLSHPAFRRAPRSGTAGLWNPASCDPVRERGDQVFGKRICATAEISSDDPTHDDYFPDVDALFNMSTSDGAAAVNASSSTAQDSSYTFVDGRVMCLEDRVAVALTLLNSGEPPETVGSSVGVNESTVSLVAESFSDAIMFKRTWYCTDSGKMEKIKYKFDKIHGLPNCCGVIHTTHIPFGPSCDHEKNNSMLMQVLLDPDMRFTSISLGSADSMNQSSFLLDCSLKECEKGELLNGNMLKVSSGGSKVGEYIIGDAGYPLLPWLLTPYQEKDLSDSKAEFNRRHSAARTLALQVLARLEDTWKFLHGWICNTYRLSLEIQLRCRLHNIVIDMEEASMARDHGVNYSKQVRRLADEDAIRVRDILSQHLTSRSSELGVDPVDPEEQQQVVSSGSGDEEKEQKVHSPGGKEEEEAYTRKAEVVEASPALPILQAHGCRYQEQVTDIVET